MYFKNNYIVFVLKTNDFSSFHILRLGEKSVHRKVVDLFITYM